jgi:hypothetical protein
MAAINTPQKVVWRISRDWVCKMREDSIFFGVVEVLVRWRIQDRMILRYATIHCKRTGPLASKMYWCLHTFVFAYAGLSVDIGMILHVRISAISIT